MDAGDPTSSQRSRRGRRGSSESLILREPPVKIPETPFHTALGKLGWLLVLKTRSKIGNKKCWGGHEETDPFGHAGNTSLAILEMCMSISVTVLLLQRDIVTKATFKAFNWEPACNSRLLIRNQHNARAVIESQAFRPTHSSKRGGSGRAWAFETSKSMSSGAPSSYKVTSSNPSSTVLRTRDQAFKYVSLWGEGAPQLLRSSMLSRYTYISYMLQT